MFTLVFKDDESGLEFQNRETGGFLAATLMGGGVDMNIGDMLIRISNGETDLCYPMVRKR